MLSNTHVDSLGVERSREKQKREEADDERGSDSSLSRVPRVSFQELLLQVLQEVTLQAIQDWRLLHQEEQISLDCLKDDQQMLF